MQNKKTKIVATLGPATSNKQTLKAMLDKAQMYLELISLMLITTMLKSE